MAHEFDADAARKYMEYVIKKEERDLEFILNKIKKQIEEDPRKRQLDFIEKANMSIELVTQLKGLGYLVQDAFYFGSYYYTISW